MTVYMQGTRRIDEIAAEARRLAYQENYSYTEGWDDNTVATIFNLALNKIYDRITQIDNVANIQEYTQSIISGQAEYDIPQDVKMKIQVMNVRFLYGPESWAFVTLVQSMIQDRFSYPTNIPSTYCIRNGKLILSPKPNVSRPEALIVNYQKRMRSLDFRRGKIKHVEGNPFGAVTAITNANPAQVTTSAAHGLITGDRVGLFGTFEPSLLKNNVFTITVTGATTFTLDNVNSTTMAVFSGSCIWKKNPNTTLINAYGSVSNITLANPGQVTTVTPHGLASGDKVGLTGTFEPNQLEQETFVVTVTGANTFTLNGIDTTLGSPFSGTCLWFKNPVIFQLNFNVTSQKDVNLQANANAILDKIDWASFVDENGSDVIDAIRVQGYNMALFQLTCAPNYVIPYASWLRFQALISNLDTFYVIQGDYASTHSQLDRQTEDYLIEYVVLRLLRLQSAAEPTEDQREAEESVLNRLAIAYRRYRPSVVPIIWQRRNNGPYGNTGGRGAY